MGAVLIVDDHHPTARAIAALLRSGGHGTIYAADGEQALKHLETNTPDVVVLDVMMPVMDGWAVLRRLRRDPRFASLPVLMYSALDDEASRATAAEAGANGYMVKGRTDWQQLLATIERYIRPTEDAGEAAPR